MSPPNGGKYTWSRQLFTALRFPLVRLAGFPTLVNLEVTRRCNARCDFCRYWTTGPEHTLDDYAPIVRKLKPVVLVFTGGEALLRPDLERVVAGVRKASPSVFLSLVTNGWLLSVPRATALWQAGLDQLTISLDFLDERHDRARGIPGLTQRILSTVPRLVTSGIDNVVLQVFIRNDNLDAVLDVVSWARDHKVKASVSAYTAAKTGVDGYSVTSAQMPALCVLVERLVTLKGEGWPIASSTYYLRRIPEFFAHGEIGGCPAGRTTLSVSPAGEIQRCSEAPVECPYSNWKPGLFGPTDCGKCWVSCRGESQAPLDWERLKLAVKSYHGRLESLEGRAATSQRWPSTCNAPPEWPKDLSTSLSSAVRAADSVSSFAPPACFRSPPLSIPRDTTHLTS